ncbi:MAG: polysaccharide deacetylase family protein [Chitinophagaceae bacterium]|nr:polysaccharide deacetylase family protein [Chitinophagaceae bacterium]
MCTRFLLLVGSIIGLSCNPNPENTTTPIKEEIPSNIAHDTSLSISPQQVYQPDKNKLYIYLTFDDGPQHGTEAVFNLCKTEGIKASFFMVGLHTKLRSDGMALVDTVRSAYPQFLLANHSFTHANGKYKKFYTQPDSAYKDFMLAQTCLKVPYSIIRLPGNNGWVLSDTQHLSTLVRAIGKKLDSAGYNIIGWDMEWHFDKHSAKPVQSAQTIITKANELFQENKTFHANHLVILMHDRMFRDSADLLKLKEMITGLRANPSVVFETVDHYPGLKWLNNR